MQRLISTCLCVLLAAGLIYPTAGRARAERPETAAQGEVCLSVRTQQCELKYQGDGHRIGGKYTSAALACSLVTLSVPVGPLIYSGRAIVPPPPSREGELMRADLRE